MSADPWANDPDRTTRNEAWGQVESSALGVANYQPIRGVVPRHAVRRGPNWYGIISAILLTVSMIGIVACFIFATRLTLPAPHPVEPAVWIQPTPEVEEAPWVAT